MSVHIAALMATITAAGVTPYDTDVPAGATLPRAILSASDPLRDRTTMADSGDVRGYFHVKVAGATAASVRVIQAKIRTALDGTVTHPDGFRAETYLTAAQAPPATDNGSLLPETSTRVIAATDLFLYVATPTTT